MRPWQLAARDPAALPYPAQLWTIGGTGQSNFESVNGNTSHVAGPVTALLGPNLRLWDPRVQSFVPAGDGGANFLSPLPPAPTQGPGAGHVVTRLMRLIADASEREVYGILHGRSSHEMAYFEEDSDQFSQNADNTFHPTLNNYQYTLQETRASGRRLGLWIFWQGESDAGDSQATYYAKAAPFSAAVWRDYRCPQIWIKPVSVGAGVRAAQQQLADERPYVYTLDNNDMTGNGTYMADGLHPNAAGYAKVADRIFAMLQRTALPGL